MKAIINLESFNDGQFAEDGYFESSQFELIKQQAIAGVSLSGVTKLVSISARKKCLNLTMPKGEIII